MSKVLAAFGDKHRQRILLFFEPDERLNVGQIAKVSTLAGATVFHYLKTLRHANALLSRKVVAAPVFYACLKDESESAGLV
jgi:predicted transcriptional regulator